MLTALSDSDISKQLVTAFISSDMRHNHRFVVGDVVMTIARGSHVCVLSLVGSDMKISTHNGTSHFEETITRLRRRADIERALECD